MTMKSKIHKYTQLSRVGVELEGGWEDPPQGMFPDGSVEISGHSPYDNSSCEDHGNYNCSDCCPSPVSGEVASQPYPLRSIELLYDWIRNIHPETVNGSCGFHIHISVGSVSLYNVLLYKEFYGGLIPCLYAWGKKNSITSSRFWGRLEKGGQYCGLGTSVSLDRSSIDRDRYKQVNYCWEKHGTVELRVFPMFRDSNTTISALKMYLEYAERYLRKYVSKRVPAVRYKTVVSRQPLRMLVLTPEVIQKGETTDVFDSHM